MSETTYLVFGDLHGRVLPAFRLAAVWAREHGVHLDGMLQVGDLGYFPDASRLDKATKRHADHDSLELGIQDVVAPSHLADDVFAEEGAPETLWFTAGNHEDFDALQDWEHGAGPHSESFVVDAYCRLRCIRDGHVETLAGPLCVGALWGIDDVAPRARKNLLPRARIRARSATALSASKLDILLAHESPRDAIYLDSGSEEITAIIGLARPSFVFFGHYGSAGHEIEGSGSTRVFHLAGLELRRHGGCAEEGSVGVLNWDGTQGEFAYLEPGWLRTFTRHNWQHR